MRAWFLSDIHLKTVNERNGNILLRFLLSLRSKERVATHLFLLGDIFDFWVGDHEFYRKKFATLIDPIRHLRQIGVEVHYFEGNHDVHVKRFWEGELGIPCWTEEKYFQLGQWLVRCEHGDFINPKDENYLKYRAFIRKPVMEKVAQILPAKLFSQVGDYASRKSRGRSLNMRRNTEEEMRVMIRDYAKEKCTDAPFDYIITGHMHVKDEFKFTCGAKEATSINLGSWLDEPKALCLDDKGYSWEIL